MIEAYIKAGAVWVFSGLVTYAGLTFPEVVAPVLFTIAGLIMFFGTVEIFR